MNILSLNAQHNIFISSSLPPPSWKKLWKYTISVHEKLSVFCLLSIFPPQKFPSSLPSLLKELEMELSS